MASVKSSLKRHYLANHCGHCALFFSVAGILGSGAKSAGIIDLRPIKNIASRAGLSPSSKPPDRGRQEGNKRKDKETLQKDIGSKADPAHPPLSHLPPLLLRSKNLTIHRPFASRRMHYKAGPRRLRLARSFNIRSTEALVSSRSGGLAANQRRAA